MEKTTTVQELFEKVCAALDRNVAEFVDDTKSDIAEILGVEYEGAEEVVDEDVEDEEEE